MKWISGLRGPFAGSLCQTLQPAFSQLGAPALTDLNNPDATRQSFVNYLGNARNATQHGTLATDPQLRAAIDQTSACQHLAAANPTNQPSQPPG